MEQEIVKRYAKDDINVIWKPALCIHAAECVKTLPEVYHPGEKPWITLGNTSVDALKNQIAKCPSGALSWELKDALEKPAMEATHVQVMPNGPLVIKGTIQVTTKDGGKHEKEGVSAFCRCGASTNKPFCDGSHHKIEFKDE